MRTIPCAVVKAIPYEERLRRYHAEKSELIRQDPPRPAEEMDALLKRLARKWRV